MDEILIQRFLNNSVETWGIFLTSLLLGFLFVRIIKRTLVNWLKRLAQKTESQLDDFIVDTLESAALPILSIIIVYSSLHILSIPSKGEKIIHMAFMFSLMYFGLNIITSLIRYTLFNYIGRGVDADQKRKQARGVLILVNIFIWGLGIVFVVNNLGYNVTTIITGLGIGGIAIALAAQTILGDLFSYFIIFFDRPFEIGDYVTVGDKGGNIEKVGIKTTRIRTLNGEQLVCSNTYLTNNPLHNFKRMDQRRVVFKMGIVYNTDLELVKQIPEIVKGIIASREKIRVDRGHFSGLGASSLDFEFVYYVETADYAFYMDRQQEIFFELLTRFAELGIEFAYPTQTLFLQKAEPPVKENDLLPA